MEKVIIMGAAGRDFHNFNIYFRNNPRYTVVAFTATQIPDIQGRLYPATLAGKGYPRGIPIFAEEDLADLIKKHSVDLVAFSYSDISHIQVMHKASLVMASGADFIFIGATYTMLRSTKPVVAVSAVRTGCGKSQVTRHVCELLKQIGKKVVAVRHPMPYGDLTRQIVQRFASYDDFKKHQCTIEEREEFEPLVDSGTVVYAGIDYELILHQAEQEADVIIWDGGNNDTPFYFPDIHIVVFDPHRVGHELAYYPGETNLLMAHLAVINKVDSAPAENVSQVKANIHRFNPAAQIILAESKIVVDHPEWIKGNRVLVVEDGPTLTHGGMPFGAGLIAAQRFGAAEIISPFPFAQGSMIAVFDKHPHVRQVLPAMGYSQKQIGDLEATICRSDCDLVVFATPIDLPKLITINKPTVRVRYKYKDHGSPVLGKAVLERLNLAP